MAPRRLVPTLAAAFAVLAAACGQLAEGPAGEIQPTAVSSPAPAPREFLELGDTAGEHAAEQPASFTAPPPRSLQRWGWAVRADGGSLAVYTDPRSGGATVRTTIDATNPWDQRIAYPVRSAIVRGGTTWYRVLLGVEPNGSSGWVRGDEVSFDRVRHRIVIDLSARMLRHYGNDRLRHRFVVGIGAPNTPTTPGTFFVWAHLDPRDATGPYGSYLLGLSGFSEVLTYWPGGGRMAIHGTADPTDRGRRVSYGCPRVYNPQMNRLRRVPMGTIVTIRP